MAVHSRRGKEREREDINEISGSYWKARKSKDPSNNGRAEGGGFVSCADCAIVLKIYSTRKQDMNADNLLLVLSLSLCLFHRISASLLPIS
jgi:hypothetical protein